MLKLIRKIFVLLRVKKYLSNSIVLSIVHSNGLLFITAVCSLSIIKGEFAVIQNILNS